MYDLIDGSWALRGGRTILGDRPSSAVFGASVSLSGDGNTVAVGAVWSDSNGEASGGVRVLRWDVDMSGWAARGSDIEGGAAFDGLVVSVALSSDGNIVAAGNYFNGAKSHVRVYEFNEASATPDWVPRDSIVYAAGAAEYDTAVDLSADGSVMAVAGYNEGCEVGACNFVRVYAWNGTNYENIANVNGTYHGGLVASSIYLVQRE